jgi:FdhE protein
LQRILEPGEIETLDHNAIPRIRLPERASVFSNRAQRLKQLATGNPIGGYLSLMAVLAEAQQQALNKLAGEPDNDARDQARINLAHAHLMPLILATDQVRSPHWSAVLDQLLDHVAKAADIPAAASQLIMQLVERIQQTGTNERDSQAEAILRGNHEIVDPASAPFYAAALQVVCCDLVTRFNVNDVPLLDTPGLCPCCGSPPVASVVRMDGQSQGHRYLQCSMCAAEWHMVRIKCSYCYSTKGIAYQIIEDGSPAIKAETCDECHNWLKIFYQEKEPYLEPLADDLASVALDLLMGETEYTRRHGNPLLWQSSEN